MQLPSLWFNPNCIKMKSSNNCILQSANTQKVGKNIKCQSIDGTK